MCSYLYTTYFFVHTVLVQIYIYMDSHLDSPKIQGWTGYPGLFSNLFIQLPDYLANRLFTYLIFGYQISSTTLLRDIYIFKQFWWTPNITVGQNMHFLDIDTLMQSNDFMNSLVTAATYLAKTLLIEYIPSMCFVIMLAKANELQKTLQQFNVT